MTDGIVVEGLSKTYRRGLLGESVRALDDVSLAVEAGEIFGIIGPNGAGKTTLLGCLLGFLRPDRGRVTVASHEPDDLEIRAVTGYLPERLVLDRWMTGREFLAYHHALAGRPASRRAAETTEALANVELPPEAGNRPIRQYSRGMLQRLGLAQALLGEPRFVFLDEPASGVDPAGVLLFRRLIAGLKGRGVTVVINSHHLDQVERVCDRVAFVSRGRVETVEVLSAGTAMARAVRIRWASGAVVVDAALLGAAAEVAGAALLEAAATTARFSVADDEGAARLLRVLIERGVPVVEAGPEEGRLERLFVAGAAGRSTAEGTS